MRIRTTKQIAESKKQIAKSGVFLCFLLCAVCCLLWPAAVWAGGQGTATITPPMVPEGGAVNVTINFTVAGATMTPGAQVRVGLPANWGPLLQTINPAGPGYVLATTTGTFNLSLMSSTTVPAFTVQITSGIAAPGNTIQIGLSNLYTSCPQPGQNTSIWNLYSSISGSDNLAAIANSPSETVSPGPARFVALNPPGTLTVASGQPSPPIHLQVTDSCGQPAVSTSTAITVNLSGQVQNGTSAAPDPGAQFSPSPTMSPVSTFTVIPEGISFTTFYYETSSSGSDLAIQAGYLSPFDGSPQTALLTVNALSSSFSFGNTSIDTGVPVPGQKTITFSPNGSGTNNFVYVRFNPSNSTIGWHVGISSNNFQTDVFDQWGVGNPQGNVFWGGQNMSSTYGQIVPNGTYAVKVEVPGLVADTSMSVTVNTAMISGTVTMGGLPVPGAQVNAQGANGPGFSQTVTDASGNYVIYGLQSGYSYNVYATYTSTTTQALSAGQLNNVAAGASGQTIALTTPGILEIAGVASSTSPVTVYGGVNVYTSNYSQNYFGTLRLQAGATNTDNGDSVNPSTWTIVAVQPGSYTIQANINGYGTPNQSETVAAGQTVQVVMPLTAMASVFGLVTLPSPASGSLWVNISGTPVGSNVPTVYGGTSFNVGQSSAIYSVFAVAPGTYTFRVQPEGYVALSQSNVVVGTANIGDPNTGGLNFSGFSAGGIIAGNITVNGDTSGQPNPLTLWVNAYSPETGDNEGTQVTLSTSSTSTSASYQIDGLENSSYLVYPPWLPGFQAPSTTPSTINAVNGQIADLNLVLNQNSGMITGAITLPSGATDYNNVHLSVQGQSQMEVNAPGSTYVLKHLGTGFYQVTATYLTTGAQLVSSVQLTNGQNFTLNLNLNIPTYSISGNVSIQSQFSIVGSSGTPVTINSFSSLLANAASQSLYIGETPDNGQFDCVNTTPTVVSTVRVEAFPKSFNSFNAPNRSGFNNCFPIGGYTYALIDSSGNFTLSGLTSGVWEIDVYPYFDNGQAPDVATVQQDITVSGNVTGVNFPLSNGYSVSGTISLPAGVSDVQTFSVQVLSSRGDTVQSAQLNLGTQGNPASSVSYQFSNLPSGQYALLVQEVNTTGIQAAAEYVAQPVQFTIASANQTNLNVSMGYAASMVGEIGIVGTNPDGSANLTLITPNNLNLLPASLQINAQSDPYVPGGSGQALPGTNGGVSIDSNNQFHINGLVPGTYDVVFSQNSYGAAIQAAGAINLASYTIGSVTVTGGQTLNLGTVSLVPGLTLSGTVVDTSGNPLSNITVRATPSNSQNGDNSIQTTTDGQGNFTLAGLSPSLKIYDIVAAPRPEGAGDPTQLVPYGQVSRLAVDVTQVPPPTLNFTLTSATAQLIGQIVTSDGGSLSFPDSGQQGYPAAAVYLHLEGSTSDDNPLGQESATNLNGSFTISDLVPGLYDITVESLGYQPYKATGVALSADSTQNLGTITLPKGPELDATLARPDGSLVSTSQVQTVVAASADLGSIIFGQVNKDATTGNILSIKFSGFQLSPEAYNVILIDSQNNITTPPEGKGLVFTSSSEVLSVALTYEQSAPFAYVNAQRTGVIGTAVNLTYYFSRPLRNQGNDQDPTQWFTLPSARGVLSGYQLSGDRTQLSVTYTPAAGEQDATIAFNAHTVDIDPTTGTQFVLSKTTTLLLGQKEVTEANINSALGGSLSLATSNDPSNVSIPGNALLNSNGAAADATTPYDFTLTGTDDINSIASVSSAAAAAQSGMRHTAIGQLMSYGSAAFVSEAYQAMSAARSNDSVNPLSSFYSVLLPAGLSHTLNQTAYLTLSYDTTADPAQINVYYYNGTEYLLQNSGRTVDTVNHTITVGVTHFSTFVVLQNSAPVVTVTGGGGSEPAIDVFNFPNPFNLQPKTEALNRGGSATSMSTNGTIIRYFIPTSEAGSPASIDIYDVVGEKVDSINLGVPSGDTYNYVSWNGQNSSGRNVASGVYIGVLKVGGNKAFFKMAVIK